jgi:hypothetical protein
MKYIAYLDELYAERAKIVGANDLVTKTVKFWAEFIDLNDDDKELANSYITDLIGDTVGARLRNISREIAELEAEEDGPNPAKLGKEDLV